VIYLLKVVIVRQGEPAIGRERRGKHFSHNNKSARNNRGTIRSEVLYAVLPSLCSENQRDFLEHLLESTPYSYARV
jgi:hypothetical protein